MNRPIEDRRLLHMLGVAEYMYYKAQEYSLDPEEMYLLGLLHDVGFISSEDEDNYVLHGDKLLENIGLVSKKGKTFRNAIRLNNQRPNFTMDWGKKSHRMRYLLYEADMHITSNGKKVSYEGRLQDIYEHYDDDGTYERCQDIIAWLEANTKT